MEKEGRKALAIILEHCGCQMITPAAFDFLYQLMAEYFEYIATSIMNQAELNNRTKPTWKDLMKGLERVQVIKTLELYAKGEIEGLLTQEKDQTIGRPTEAREQSLEQSFSLPEPSTDLPSKNFDSLEHTVANIHSHFPPFPPQHSYLQTRVLLHPLVEDAKFRKQKLEHISVMESNLKNLLMNSFKVSGDFTPLIDVDMGFADFTVNKLP